jgi:hypothetical protein
MDSWAALSTLAPKRVPGVSRASWRDPRSSAKPTSGGSSDRLTSEPTVEPW